MIRPHLRLGVVVAMAGSSACVTLPAPNLATRPSVSIAASVDKTWESALDQLAAQGIALRAVERSSGFIATETIALPVFAKDPGAWADCGAFAGFRYAPTAVDYTVLVRGNASASSMRASARYRVLTVSGEVPIDCVSSGAFERSFEALAKQRAETAP